MILITGGLGFIGTHTARALLDLGQSCALVQRRAPDQPLPEPIAGEAGTRIFVEQADVTDLPALLKIGERHEITGVLHLAVSVPWPPSPHPVADSRAAVESLLGVLQAASDWGVPRVCVASTIGVYGGVDAAGPLREDLPLPMTSGHVIPAFKKIGELLNDYIAAQSGMEVVNLRIAGIWGPLGRTASPFFAAPQMVHAAVRGTVPDFSQLRSPVYAQDGLDLCYVKDCGRAIALLQQAPRLNHRTYNVAAGRPTSNGEVAEAIRKVVPDARIELPEGRDPNGPGRDLYLDITRLREDTGFEPSYNTEQAAADYVAWLKAGNER
ncbi:MAG TPA: NAD(P)-dependent oxidoreductase [Actinocrinis sp.]|uniref:NAD-dependent epimerase/dehydratase family protein n=1 Tax=Actinocrinis sp. TaxID=1920516 RepID=UPI002DDD8807|nr:NAD(P)-dependent oxidoreductase [Actinocrinis sp.]HEV2347617.1 NAD(P)-dependent oxidoreductase [Actinocrinis sp.]